MRGFSFLSPILGFVNSSILMIINTRIGLRINKNKSVEIRIYG
ncbi:hypothetical protein DEALK_17460 [Dehalogenimonas alkenigignens]|uniref:Uncharacterized protein n=1 Tax=Dehalogenimonas alkenigignens TaxID=1217799 RepID=A0A0W0GK47_9CHLR|nr:hypothetical protein DEALK_17460 [Dehalogenimonas alkenigignens]